MHKRRVYIKAATQISIQEPLSEAWIDNPIRYDDSYVRSIDPSFREWLNPLESRRMGKILKRALVTSMKVMRDTGISQPNAIITGTGLGCIENTEIFLNQLSTEGEEMLKPTCFMQSTHNTVSSLIAIYGKCHGYNSTYSHKGISFDSALLDAYTQIVLGEIDHALVTGNDEMTPSYFNILQRTGYIGQPGQCPASEASVAMMLSTDGRDALCEIEDIGIRYGTDGVPQLPAAPDTILTGRNGDAANDEVYDTLRGQLPNVQELCYKSLFGECYTASALGVYAAAQLIYYRKVPAVMSRDGSVPSLAGNILVVNHCEGKDFTFISLAKAD